jgi:hypothetical protein
LDSIATRPHAATMPRLKATLLGVRVTAIPPLAPGPGGRFKPGELLKKCVRT